MKNDLIRRSDAIKAIANDGDEQWWYEERINEVPAVDAVEVVRCKVCKHYNLQALACTHNNFNGWIGMDGFCSYGEPRMDGE